MKEKDEEVAIKHNVNPSAEQVAAWKAKYGRLEKMTLTGEDDEGNPFEMIFYARRKFQEKYAVLELASKKLMEKNLRGYQETILHAVLLNGEAKVKADPDVFMILASRIDKIINTINIEVEKI